MNPEDVPLAALGLAPGSVEWIERLSGGGNSQVYRLHCTASGTFAAKRYLQDDPLGRDRFRTELRALRFLRDAGIEAVPAPVGADERTGWILFEHVEGDPVDPTDVDSHEVEALVRFLEKLQSIRPKPPAGLPTASDACFKVRDVEAILERRRRKLFHVEDQPELDLYITEELDPTIERIVEGARARADAFSLPVRGDLPRHRWVLSPSDFGFHNSLRRPDGRLAFVDFEYFGWDDPAKLVCDTLLHPKMELTGALANRLVEGILDVYGDPGLLDRIRVLYPVYGLVWSMILLNEFTVEGTERRAFATGEPVDHEQILEEQLSKSRAMLKHVRTHEDRFPYDPT